MTQRLFPLALVCATLGAAEVDLAPPMRSGPIAREVALHAAAVHAALRLELLMAGHVIHERSHQDWSDSGFALGAPDLDPSEDFDAAIGVVADGGEVRIRYRLRGTDAAIQQPCAEGELLAVAKLVAGVLPASASARRPVFDDAHFQPDRIASDERLDLGFAQRVAALGATLRELDPAIASAIRLEANLDATVTADPDVELDLDAVGRAIALHPDRLEIYPLDGGPLRILERDAAAWAPFVASQRRPTGETTAVATESGEVLLWGQDDAPPTPLPRPGASGEAVFPRWGPNGRIIVIQDGDRIELHREPFADPPAVVADIDLPWVRMLAVDDDRPAVLVADDDNALHLVDADGAWPIDAAGMAGGRQASADPDGPGFVVVDWNAAAWRVAAGAAPHRLFTLDQEPAAIGHMADGRFAAVGFEGDAWVWDGTELAHFRLDSAGWGSWRILAAGPAALLEQEEPGAMRLVGWGFPAVIPDASATEPMLAVRAATLHAVHGAYFARLDDERLLAHLGAARTWAQLADGLGFAGDGYATWRRDLDELVARFALGRALVEPDAEDLLPEVAALRANESAPYPAGFAHRPAVLWDLLVLRESERPCYPADALATWATREDGRLEAAIIRARPARAAGDPAFDGAMYATRFSDDLQAVAATWFEGAVPEETWTEAFSAAWSDPFDLLAAKRISEGGGWLERSDLEQRALFYSALAAALYPDRARAHQGLDLSATEREREASAMAMFTAWMRMERSSDLGSPVSRLTRTAFLHLDDHHRDNAAVGDAPPAFGPWQLPSDDALRGWLLPGGAAATGVRGQLLDRLDPELHAALAADAPLGSDHRLALAAAIDDLLADPDAFGLGDLLDPLLADLDLAHALDPRRDARERNSPIVARLIPGLEPDHLDPAQRPRSRWALSWDANLHAAREALRAGDRERAADITADLLAVGDVISEVPTVFRTFRFAHRASGRMDRVLPLLFERNATGFDRDILMEWYLDRSDELTPTIAKQLAELSTNSSRDFINAADVLARRGDLERLGHVLGRYPYGSYVLIEAWRAYLAAAQGGGDEAWRRLELMLGSALAKRPRRMIRSLAAMGRQLETDPRWNQLHERMRCGDWLAVGRWRDLAEGGTAVSELKPGWVELMAIADGIELGREPRDDQLALEALLAAGLILGREIAAAPASAVHAERIGAYVAGVRAYRIATGREPWVRFQLQWVLTSLAWGADADALAELCAAAGGADDVFRDQPRLALASSSAQTMRVHLARWARELEPWDFESYEGEPADHLREFTAAFAAGEDAVAQRLAAAALRGEPRDAFALAGCYFADAGAAEAWITANATSDARATAWRSWMREPPPWHAELRALRQDPIPPLATWRTLVVGDAAR